MPALGPPRCGGARPEFLVHEGNCIIDRLEIDSAGAERIDIRPFLLDGDRGRLFATYFAPHGARHPIGDVLVVPPFAEEMNRCRSMVAAQARALAQTGVGTLVVDLHGTGDSDGEFVDATWDGWRADLGRALAWLRAHGNGCSTLLAIRLGAILATELARDAGGIERLLLWQPVLGGKSFLTQFLRIRIAAEMELPDRIKTTGELRALSARGEPVEVSGYALGAPMVLALDAAEFELAMSLPPWRTHWFEVLVTADATTGRANAKAVEEAQAAGAAIELQRVVGPPFWHVHERQLAPALIDATTRCVAGWADDGAACAVVPSAYRREAESTAGAALLPITFECSGERLSGVVHCGAAGDPRGVVIVVAGGPQYRIGAHRQFIGLARQLAAQGVAVLRFDLRGMGDSSGEYVGFQHSESDLRAAIDALQRHQPQVRDVVLVGECESASGILFYAWRDARVRGAVLINPWVRTDEGQAQVIVKHYYLDRLRSKEFWRLVRSGGYDVRASLASMIDVIRAFVRGRREMARAEASGEHADMAALSLPVKTATGLKRFKGEVLLLMSGRDYIAREFDEVTAASRAWDGLLASPRIVRCDVAGADHTFSRAAWKQAASRAVLGWLARWPGGFPPP